MSCKGVSRLRENHFDRAGSRWPLRLGQARSVWSIWSLWFIWLVWSIWLVLFTKKPDRPNRPDRQDRPNRPHEQDRLADCFSLLLGTGRGRQTHVDARVVLIDVFVEVGFDDTVVVDAESLTEGILRDLEPAIDVSP